MKEGFVEAVCKIFEKNGVVSHQQSLDLQKSFKDRSDVAFEDFLIEEGLIEKEDILTALADYYAVPWMHPIGYFFDHMLVIKFPKDFLLRNLVIPIEVIDDVILMVLANNPGDEDLLVDFGKYVSYDIEFRVGLASEIVESIEEFYDKSLVEQELDDPTILDDNEFENEARREIEEISEDE